jgi:PIN domain nuclease of toxin-antitoxin system
VLILDTCAIIFDSLDPARLSQQAADAISQADEAGTLACCDISLWEIAMLVAKGRLDPGTDARKYLQLVLAARRIKVLPITAEIAVKSASPDLCSHGDPADRIIAATTLIHKAKLVTSDRKLATIAGLNIVW